MTEDALARAIVTSGYPLQTIAASALAKRDFVVQEEWAYRDPETDTRRAVDLVSEWKTPQTPHETDAGSSTLTLSLIMECKQSQSPYVFFESVNSLPSDRFPLISGLGNGMVEIAPDFEWTEPPYMKWNKAPFTREVSINTFLKVVTHRFVEEPKVISAISKATGNGKKVRLSGDEPFNALLMPLTKAASVYRSELSPYRSAKSYHDVRAVIPVAVLDAPMLLVGSFGKTVKPEAVSWVRAVVRRAGGEHQWWDPLDHDVVDIVHRSYLNKYLDRFALPYSRLLWKQHQRHHDVSLGGRAYITGLSEDEPLGERLLDRLVEAA